MGTSTCELGFPAGTDGIGRCRSGSVCKAVRAAAGWLWIAACLRTAQTVSASCPIAGAGLGVRRELLEDQIEQRIPVVEPNPEERQLTADAMDQGMVRMSVGRNDQRTPARQGCFHRGDEAGRHQLHRGDLVDHDQVCLGSPAKDGGDADTLQRLDIDGVLAELGAASPVQMRQRAALTARQVLEGETNTMSADPQFLGEHAADGEIETLHQLADQCRLAHPRSARDRDASVAVHSAPFYLVASLTLKDDTMRSATEEAVR